jgi:hypothetical protein
MAPFSNNQVKYIQAVAGRQQHTTLKAINLNGVIKSNDYGGNFFTPQTFDTSDPLLLSQFYLHEAPHCWDARGVHNNDILESADFTNVTATNYGFGSFIGELRALDVPCIGETGTDGDRIDDEWISSTKRATPDGYLKSLNLKLRLTLPSNIPVAHPSYADIKSIMDKGAPGGNSQLTTTDYENYWNGTISYPQPGVSVPSEAMVKAIQSALDVYARQHPMHTPHYEFRLIMFRNKLPTYRNTASSNNLDAIRNGVSLLNAGYDLFMGQTGRPRGPLGYRTSPKLDKNMDPTGAPAPYYSGKYWDTVSSNWANGSVPAASGDAGHGDTTGSLTVPLGEGQLTHRDLMTMPLNTNDYVVMRDVRFFLGQAQGKSHYEDVFDFDFNDVINTADTDLMTSDTLVDKNYRWQCVIIGTSNGQDPVHLNYEIRGTTCCKSG